MIKLIKKYACTGPDLQYCVCVINQEKTGVNISVQRLHVFKDDVSGYVWTLSLGADPSQVSGSA